MSAVPARGPAAVVTERPTPEGKRALRRALA
jgi:hypothetical protein